MQVCLHTATEAAVSAKLLRLEGRAGGYGDVGSSLAIRFAAPSCSVPAFTDVELRCRYWRPRGSLTSGADLGQSACTTDHAGIGRGRIEGATGG